MADGWKKHMDTARLATLKRKLRGIRAAIDDHTRMLAQLKNEEEDIVAKLAAAEEHHEAEAD